MKIKLLFATVIFSITGFVNLKAQPKGDVIIKNATVITVSGNELENTDILVRNGLIADIGQNLRTPGGVETIDATGRYVAPGIIDAHSHLNGIDINEGTNPVTGEVIMSESIAPNRVSIYHALAGGVTTINLMHGSANVIGGRNVTLKLRYGQNQNNLIFKGAPQTIKFALGENPTRVHGQGSGVLPRTRMGVEMVIRNHFDAAIDYRRNRTAYLEEKDKFENGVRDNPPVPIAKNLRLDVIADILDNKILVHSHSYRADEILMLARVLEEYGVKNYTFQHANEAFKVAPELAKLGANASIFSDWWSYKFEVYYSTAYSAAILNENGVVTSINSDSNELIRHLNLEAAKAMKYGQTSKQDAMKMITLHPAIQLGIDEWVGSIEVGKHADLSIWSEHPLSIYSINEMTLVDGVVYFDRENDEDDMRLDRAISPIVDYSDTENIFYDVVDGRSEHACMQDMFYLFETEGNRHAHGQLFHKH